MLKSRHIFFAAIISLSLFIDGCKMVLLDPKGVIAADEKHLLITGVLLMLIVVVPVIFLTLAFAWKYRASNVNAKYEPDWAHNTLLEIVWWTIPCIIIVILAIITWISSHRLDPYKPLNSTDKPLTIQAISLEWKWLFIYPDQHIATINYVELPVQQPVLFLITSDAPMNSFQIPQLAGQIYAMAGMQTKLNLIANVPGDYAGLSTNFSGQGFSDMKFDVKAVSPTEFNQWVKQIKKSPQKLTSAAYDKIAQPSENDAVQYFSNVDKNMFSNVIMKFMMPMNNKMAMSSE